MQHTLSICAQRATMHVQPTSKQTCGGAFKRTSPTRRVLCTATTVQPEQFENRWEQQLKDGTVRNIPTFAVAELVLRDDWVLLDVRPPNEVARARIRGALNVPLYIPDDDSSLGGLSKKAAAYLMGGWWLGGPLLKPNAEFISEVLSSVPKDAKVIVGCQRGLRSLAACEALSNAGYSQLAWVNGGFDTAETGEIPTVDGTDIRLAGIGGLSSLFGLTEVQKELAGPGAAPTKGLTAALALVLLLNAALLVWALEIL